MALFCGLKIPSLKVESSVLSLLPEAHSEYEKYSDEAFRRLDGMTVFMLDADDDKTSAAATLQLVQKLKRIPSLKNLSAVFDDETLQKSGRFYLEHITSLIDPKTRESLKAGRQANFVLSSLYMPAGAPQVSELKADPLLLMRSRQLNTASSLKYTIADNLLSVVSEGRVYRIVSADFATDSYSLHDSKELAGTLENAVMEVKQNFPSVSLRKRGTIFYSVYAASSAQHDISVLGSLTIIGVLLLIIVVYRSPWPVIMTLLSLLCGLTAGTFALVVCFDSCHLIIMLMSLSIVGICLDYSLHFASRRLIHAKTEAAHQSAHTLKKTLLSALATTAITYAIVLVPPFPGIRQLAVFCIGALVFSCLSVLILLPYADRLRVHRPFALWELRLKDDFKHALSLWYKYRVMTTLLCVMTAASAFFTMNFNDDPSVLQSMPEALKDDDSKIATVMGQDNSQTFMLTADKSLNDLADSFDKVRQLCDLAVKRGIVKGCTIPAYNSAKLQHEDYKLLSENYETLKSKLNGLSVKLGEIPYKKGELSFDDYLRGPEGEFVKRLILRTDKEYICLIPLDTLVDREALKQLIYDSSLHNTTVMDRHGDFTLVFEKYRKALLYAFVSALLFIFAVQYFKQKSLYRALRHFMPTLLSVLCAIAFNGAIGYPLTLFSVLALFLVLGIGIDYVIFMGSGRAPGEEVLFSITMALLTTLLTLGILLLSSTAAVSSFGAILSAGILVSYLMSPWCLDIREK